MISSAWSARLAGMTSKCRAYCRYVTAAAAAKIRRTASLFV
jgi:hypothetical protein